MTQDMFCRVCSPVDISQRKDPIDIVGFQLLINGSVTQLLRSLKVSDF